MKETLRSEIATSLAETSISTLELASYLANKICLPLALVNNNDNDEEESKHQVVLDEVLNEKTQLDLLPCMFSEEMIREQFGRLKFSLELVQSIQATRRLKHDPLLFNLILTLSSSSDEALANIVMDICLENLPSEYKNEMIEYMRHVLMNAALEKRTLRFKACQMIHKAVETKSAEESVSSYDDILGLVSIEELLLVDSDNHAKLALEKLVAYSAQSGVHLTLSCFRLLQEQLSTSDSLLALYVLGKFSLLT